MNTTSLRSRYEELKEQIHFHNHRYHVLDAPVVSDAEFDQLLNELKRIEAEHPDWVTPDSPTQRAGAKPADRFEKVRHPAPILSLANAFAAGDARAWLERVSKIDDRVEKAKFVVEPKIDGLSVVLHYRDGVFVQGATRGDGEVGEVLSRLVYERLVQYRELRGQTVLELAEAYRWLGIVQMRMGGQMLRQSAIGLKPAVALKVVARSSVGVEYPSVSAEALPLQPVGLMWTDVSFDEARKRLRDLTITLSRLGEAENALWRLLAARRKTQKRVNALKYNIIPRYRATVSHIKQALEEDERNTLFQIKVLRGR